MIETVTVAELFEEELIALEEQHEKLIKENTQQSRLTAQKLENIMEYFKVRLGMIEGTMEEIYGAGPDETLH